MSEMSAVTPDTTGPPTAVAEAQMDKLEADLTETFRDPYFGILPDELVAYVDHKKIKWGIHERAATKSIRDEIMTVTDAYEQKMLKLEKKRGANKLEKSRLYEETNKHILELALNDFDYDKWADDPKAGPVILGHLTRELSLFLVEHGGKTGTSYLQTLQNLDTLSRYRMLGVAPKSGGYSPGARGESAP